MIVKIKIAVCDKTMSDMELSNVNNEYVDFFFNSARFSGYWIAKDTEGKDEEIMCYIDGRTFVTPYSPETIAYLNSLMEDEMLIMN